MLFYCCLPTGCLFSVYNCIFRGFRSSSAEVQGTPSVRLFHYVRFPFKCWCQALTISKDVFTPLKRTAVSEFLLAAVPVNTEFSIFRQFECVEDDQSLTVVLGWFYCIGYYRFRLLCVCVPPPG